MSCYIASNNNRLYVALEESYGRVGQVSAVSRVPAVRLDLRQATDRPRRTDKTGSRTYLGLPRGHRQSTGFALTTLLTEWSTSQSAPSYGSLFQAALGREALRFGGGTVASAAGPSSVAFTAPHGLLPDQAITHGGDIRFVQAIVDAHTVITSAPFTNVPGSGSLLGPTVTYLPATKLPSVSIYDYWDPEDAVQRIVNGAAVDRMRMSLNGDFHQFEFDGPAADIIDNASFQSGQAALQAFPPEPPQGEWNYALVPGNLGQAWLGVVPSQVFSILHADLTLNNNVQLRNREFGVAAPICFAAGERRVALDFTLYSSSQPEIKSLYEAARFRAPISVMFQLGEQPGQMCGIQMKTVVPEYPAFADQEVRLQWQFRNCQAQGLLDDDIVIAFG